MFWSLWYHFQVAEKANEIYLYMSTYQIYEMIFIKELKPTLKKQSDSISTV